MVSILAGLVIAGGVLFPEVKAAAAQGSHSGYTYTERICQEYGQQPRRYQVRDPIIGSDWRNDGGWAIVLESGAHFREAEYRFPAVGEHSDSEYIGGHATASAMYNDLWTGWLNNQQVVGADDNGVWENLNAFGIRSGTLLTAPDGTQGFVTTQYYGQTMIVDQNGNGELDAGDARTGTALGRVGTGNNLYYAEKRRIVRVVEPLNYGGSYIRWANMAWCR